MKKTLTFTLFFLCLITLSAILKFNQKHSHIKFQETETCPEEGAAKTEHKKKSNQLKNRILFPSKKDIDSFITLKKILESGSDMNRWQNNKAVSIIGYVYDVKNGGVESCNCKDPKLRDAHIEILTDPMKNEKTHRMVVEVTPRIRKIMLARGINWETKALRDNLLGRWVKFEGWLFFDEEHLKEAENTNPGRSRNWRATAWEIHPVTNIEVTVKPK